MKRCYKDWVKSPVCEPDAPVSAEDSWWKSDTIQGADPRTGQRKLLEKLFFFALSARAVVLFSCLCACALPSASGLFCAAVLVPPCSLLLEFWRDVATCAPSQRADSREERIAKGHTFVLTVHSDASFVSHKGTSAWREEPKTESMFQGKGSRIAPSLF